MINSLHIKILKGFKQYDISFNRLNLLIGSNNSGKTTIFHALQLAFWCIENTMYAKGNDVIFGKTQKAEIDIIPYYDIKDLFYMQRMREGRKPARIIIRIETSVAPTLSFEIYPVYSRNLIVTGGFATITGTQYDNLVKLRPLYIPGTVGIIPKEDLYRSVSQERLRMEGRQNEVLRNLVYELIKHGQLDEFLKIVNPLFSLSGIDVVFNEDTDRWLTAIYRENNCVFDFVSAGSGFLQVINLLGLLFLYSPKVVLLDEPDSHMHDDLLLLAFESLNTLSLSKDIQLIIATHSPTLIDNVGYSVGYRHLLIINQNETQPNSVQNEDELIPLLDKEGIFLSPRKLANVLNTKKVLFVENEKDDYKHFIYPLGEVCHKNFSFLTRHLAVLSTEGSTTKNPLDGISYFERLIGTDLSYVYLRDRDFLADEEIREQVDKNKAAKGKIIYLTRRNRESYLLEPSILARLIQDKWLAKYGKSKIPDELKVDGISLFILKKARELQDDTLVKFEVDHEPILRGDSSHRSAKLHELHVYFNPNYRDQLAQDTIPYKLLDAKETLRALREHLSTKYRLSFSDLEIIKYFTIEEVDSEIKHILEEIINLCS